MQVIARSIGEILLNSEIPFRGLNGRVSEGDLDLIELSAAFVSKLGISTPQIMRGDSLAAGFHASPNPLRGQGFPGHMVALIDTPKYKAVGDAGCCLPVFNRHLGPVRHRHSPD